MRTKEINWWFRPNETAVQINRPHRQKQTEPLNESRPASLCGVINRGVGRDHLCIPPRHRLGGWGVGGEKPPQISIKHKFSGLFIQAQLDTTILALR